MRLQQVITGAANDKASAVTVGRIRGIPLVVCGALPKSGRRHSAADHTHSVLRLALLILMKKG